MFYGRIRSPTKDLLTSPAIQAQLTARRPDETQDVYRERIELSDLVCSCVHPEIEIAN